MAAISKKHPENADLSGASAHARPDIYTYHDYRQFMRDWMAFLKATLKYSVRRLAKTAGVSESYLSMVLSGDRSLSETQLAKILPHLELDQSERSYLEWLRTIIETDSQEERLEALKKIQRFRQYRKLNPLEIETYHYLTHWHYVAIRELAVLPDFQQDPKWIQKALKHKVSVVEIKRALDFLIRHEFIELNADGSIKRPEKRIHCKTGVLRPALTKFHKEMLNMACDSIDNTPSEARNISAHTCAIPTGKVAAAKAILDEARAKIIALTEAGDENPDAVDHFSFLAFPLTKTGEET